MNPDASQCPFCNGILPGLPTLPVRDKLPCPRCGEPVPASRWRVDTAIIERPRTAQPAALPATVPGKRNTAFVVLAIMAVMAAIGLSYMLWTVNLRRSRDPHKAETPEPITFRKPLELSGLGYLPKGCQIVAGLHIAEMMDDKVKTGKDLLAEPRPAMLDWILNQIPRTTGMKLEHLDHILIGIAADEHFPQAVLVVKTRLKYSPERIVEAIQPRKSSLYEGEALYEFSLKPMGEAMLWCVDEHTLVYVVRLDEPKIEHLQGLSVKARPVEDVLSAELRQTLAERLARHHFAWVAGQLDQPATQKKLQPFLPEPVKDVKIFALGLEPVAGLTLTGNFLLKDANAADRFKAFLEGVKVAGATSQTLVLPPPEEINQWLTWQVRGDVGTLRAFLNKGKEMKK